MPEKPVESEEQTPEVTTVDPLLADGVTRYLCLNGMNYGDIRRERGDIVDDIPAQSIDWMLEYGHIQVYTGQELPPEGPIPHVERVVQPAAETDVELFAHEPELYAAEHPPELAEAGYPIIESVVVVLEQEPEADVREAVIEEIDEQQALNAAAEGE